MISLDGSRLGAATLASVMVLVSVSGCTTAGLDEDDHTAPASASAGADAAYLARVRQQAPETLDDDRLIVLGRGFCKTFTRNPSELALRASAAFWARDGFTPYGTGWGMAAAVTEYCPDQTAAFSNVLMDS